MSTTWPPAIEIIHLTMRFGELTALDDVSLRFWKNRVHAILGENGAGKSTLVKCLIGYHQPTQGQLCVMNEQVQFQNPKDAQLKGIGMVYQHFTLIDNMTVAENFLLSSSHIPFVISWQGVKNDLMRFLERAPFQVPLDERVGNLAAGQKQKLEILKQIYLKNKILILDEPTSVLTPEEADEVLGYLRHLVEEKMLTVILITHKLREVEKYADDVTVLRKGKLVLTGNLSDYQRSELVRAMVGEDVSLPIRKNSVVQNQESRPIFVARKVRAEGLKDFSLVVRAGEIVGLAGVSGNGQKEFVDVLCGLQRYQAEELSVNGEAYCSDFDFLNSMGVSLLPELPLQNACVAEMSLWENLILKNFKRRPFSRYTLMQRRNIIEQVSKILQEYKVKYHDLDLPIRTLSGGNVQRAVLGRELSENPKLLIVANPCFGLDILAATEIRQRLMSARDSGTAVLLISEDLEEILELSDRIAVLFGGKIVFEVSGDAATFEQLGHYMAVG